MSKNVGIVRLRAGDLQVDPAVQRPLDVRRVRYDAEHFNPDGLGVLTVSKRSNGSYIVLDGQHRTAIVKLVGDEDYKLNCEVFEGLTTPEEAALFRVRNNMRRVRALDLFLVRLTEGDPIAKKVEGVVEDNGWKVGVGDPTKLISAVVRMERVLQMDPDSVPTALEKALATSTRAWGHVPGAGDGRIIEGLGLVYVRYGAAVDTDSMIRRMATFEAGPLGLLGRAHGLASIIRAKAPQALAEVVVDEYNRHRRSSRLPEWRS